MSKDLLECNIKGVYLPMRWIVCLIMCGSVMVYDIERHLLSPVITTIFGNPIINTTLCPVGEKDRLIPPKINMTLDFTYSSDRMKFVEESFYISYLFFHIPCGIIIDRIGARAVVGLGMAISTVALILTPIFYWSTPISVVISAIMGAAQLFRVTICQRFVTSHSITAGITTKRKTFCKKGRNVDSELEFKRWTTIAPLFPGINSLCAAWAPYFQRGVILGLIFGTYGFIRAINFATISKMLENINSWHASFYIWGVFGLTWYIIFLIYLYSEPQQHPYMTNTEKEYMKMKAVQRKQNLKVPWKAIITDKAIWAIISAELAFSVGNYTWNTEAKKYFWESFAYDIEYSTVYYVWPHIYVVLFTLGTGIVNDYLIRSGKMSVKSVRKIFSTLGICLPAVLMVISGQAGCNKYLALWLFVISLVLECAVCGAGHMQNILDISVNFPGVVMGIVNALGTSCLLAIPHLFHFLERTQMKEQWKIAYYFALVTAVLLNIFFLMNVSGKRADWDFAPGESETWPENLREMRLGKRKSTEKQHSEDDDDLSD